MTCLAFHTRRARRIVALAIAAVIASAAPVAAQRGDPAPTRHVHRVSPAVSLWLSSPLYRDVHGPWQASAAGPDVIAPVTIRLDHPASMARLRTLESAHMRLSRINGRVSHVGGVVSAAVTETGAAQLAEAAFVVRVELDLSSPLVAPLHDMGGEVQAHAVWNTLDKQGIRLTGAGVVIADIDTGIDVLHPALFRADGAYHAWIDVDQNGVFEPGVDAIDLDGDGQAGAGEIAGFFDARSYGFFGTQPILGTANGVFDAGTDHLFVDLDGDRVRDFGVAAGFSETDPGYGEPLFAVDDVNRNGLLDVSEKLIALGSSKIRAVYNSQTVFTRGVDLIATPGHRESNGRHGTQMSGILVAGNRGLSHHVGVAPDAELLVGAYGGTSGQLSVLLSWAIAEGADVILHEYSAWFGRHMDGSTNHEAMMDAAAAQGVVHVNAAGNLGGSGKLAVVSLAPQGTDSVPIRVPVGLGNTFFETTVHWRELSRDMSFTLTAPSGEAVNLGTTGGSFSLAGGAISVSAYRDDSSRGTALFDIVLVSGSPLPTGQWRLTVTDTSAAPVGSPASELSMYLIDNRAGAGSGVRFEAFISEKYLVAWPATADSAFTVAAYAGHGSPPINTGIEGAGQLRSYSGRGTRLDGFAALDIASPDNPLTTVNALSIGGTPIPHGSFMVGSGTSAASPHVAGVAALLKQHQPGLDSAALRQQLRAGALVDEHVVGDVTHTASELWGAGKIRAYRALYGTDPAPNTAPVVTVVDAEAVVGQPVTVPLQASDAEDDPDSLQVRVDRDYDGVWDLGPVRVASAPELVFDSEGAFVIKLDVTDSGGLSSAALAVIDVRSAGAVDAGVIDASSPPDSPAMADPPDDDVDDTGSCGCATGGGDSGSALMFAVVAIWLRRRRAVG